MDINIRLLVKDHFLNQMWLVGWLLVALVGYTVLSIFSDNLAKPFIDLILLAALVAFFFAPKPVTSSPAIYIFVFALAAALLTWALMLLQHADIAESSPQVHKLTYWFFLIPIAFACGGDRRKVIGIWLIAGVALVFTPWVKGIGVTAIVNGITGSRTDLNLLNAQHAAMYFAVLALGAVAVLPRLLALKNLRWLAVGACLLVLVYALVAVIITQTRAVWLGLSIALIVQMAVSLRVTSASWRRVTRLVAMVVIPLIIVLATNWQLIQQRVIAESDSIAALWADDAIAFDSAGIRLHFWRESLHWIAERPLVGWGVEGKKMVIQQADSFPEAIKKQDLSHLHNSFLDALVNFGLLGLAAIVALWAYLVRACVQLWRNGHISNDLLVFYLSFLALWFVINCFESYMQFASGRFVFALISGGMLSLVWRTRLLPGKSA
ncbi:O-antigen ligase family protein [Simiduia litorea]|uniref:O-antigen ligase family protein n=1 Tax=Simiduia litorea TaxID=1435348 RepID=UPI0036F3496E